MVYLIEQSTNYQKQLMQECIQKIYLNFQKTIRENTSYSENFVIVAFPKLLSQTKTTLPACTILQLFYFILSVQA